MTFNRKMAIATLTANVEAWKGKEATLNELSDADLQMAVNCEMGMGQGDEEGEEEMKKEAEGRRSATHSPATDCSPLQLASECSPQMSRRALS